jgi:RNA polymerase sigma-70 factor, ECF subfamily
VTPSRVVEPVAAERIRALYARHAAGLRRHLERLVGDADAEDLVHDVFEKAQRSLASHRGDSRVSTWLYRIATHAALDRLRGRAVREREDSAAAARAQEGAEGCHRPPDAELVRARMRACVLELVNALPPGQREVLTLAELRGLDDRQTAEALGISLGAAKIRLHRGRAALKKLVACECQTYRDGAGGLTCERLRHAAVDASS